MSNIYYTTDGTPTITFTTLPVTTYTATSIIFDDAAGMSNTVISTSAVVPFPSGDYSNFTYEGFIDEMGIDVEGGGENVFSLPSYVPSFLAGIPAIRSAYPKNRYVKIYGDRRLYADDIAGGCTVGAGQGEPTIHVPVQLLTGESHVTITMNGAYEAAGASTASVATTPTTHDNVPGSTDHGSSQTARQSPSGGSAASGSQSAPTAASAGTGDGSQSLVQSNGSPTSANSGGPQQSAPPSTNAILPTVSDGNTPPSSDDASTTSPGVGGYIASVIGLGRSSSPDTQPNTTPVHRAGIGQATTIDADGQPLTISQAGASAYNVNGQTVSAGDVANIGGHTVSIPTSGTQVVVDNSVTASLPSLAANTGALDLPSATVGYSQVGNAYVFGSQTLSDGNVATVSGETLSLGSSGVLVIDGTSTTRLPQQTLVEEGVVTIAGDTLTFERIGTEVVIASQTLMLGEVITVDAETLSLATGSNKIVAISGAQTSTIDLVATTTESEASTSSPSYTAFSNGAVGLGSLAAWQSAILVSLLAAVI